MTNTTLNQELVNKLINALRNIDCFTEYIDNYKQQKAAEDYNDKLKVEMTEIVSQLVDCPEKADAQRHVMWMVLDRRNKAAEEIVNAWVEKNVPAMVETPEETINEVEKKEVINMTKSERMVQTLEFVKEIKNVHDENYVGKEELAKFLFDNDITGRMLSKNELKKTKREVFVDILATAVQNLINAGIITPVKAYSVNPLDDMDLDAPINDEEDGVVTVVEHREDGIPVGDLNITKDNAPAVVSSAQAKTAKLLSNIHNCALNNEKKGFGYTISTFMLQWSIINAENGLNRLKGHKVTEEEHKTTVAVFKWLKEKNYITAAVYSVKEADDVRVYVPDVYSGRNETSIKMIPLNHSAGYNAKAVTSYALTDEFKKLFK